MTRKNRSSSIVWQVCVEWTKQALPPAVPTVCKWATWRKSTIPHKLFTYRAHAWNLYTLLGYGGLYRHRSIIMDGVLGNFIVLQYSFWDSLWWRIGWNTPPDADSFIAVYRSLSILWDTPFQTPNQSVTINKCNILFDTLIFWLYWYLSLILETIALTTVQQSGM